MTGVGIELSQTLVWTAKKSNNACFIWLKRSNSDFIKSLESVLSIQVCQLRINSHILVMTLKRIVTWNSSHEPRLDPRSDFPLKYHCETGGQNCDGSYDAGPEDWVGKDDHLKVSSFFLSIFFSSPEVCRRRQPQDRERHAPRRICTKQKSGWTHLQKIWPDESCWIWLNRYSWV